MITQKKAIHLAEQFIRYQGYINESIPFHHRQFIDERFDRSKDEENVRKIRNNTLKPKAVAILVNNIQSNIKKNNVTYTVGFKYSHPIIDKYNKGSKNNGRAVIIQTEGLNYDIYMKHKDIFLDNKNQLMDIHNKKIILNTYSSPSNKERLKINCLNTSHFDIVFERIVIRPSITKLERNNKIWEIMAEGKQAKLYFKIDGYTIAIINSKLEVISLNKFKKIVKDNKKKFYRFFVFSWLGAMEIAVLVLIGKILIIVLWIIFKFVA
jgi:hypothetical protein